ncbi:hypothetical protein LENED_004198 [Lentinula edodes]|uniref:Reverse transcriptase domain-containing protein n=1 Tax=Lentinula edodes TaxID=5353 RepID=A0A1Q3E5W0_LENED|nr:hypothetical protein LENED_004198 [Lentinula edodes]
MEDHLSDPYGSYEWKVMPFGLTNAPAAFQRFVNDIFSDMLDVCVIVYLDDILIYSDTPEEHREHVKEVLRRLRKHRLYANPEKCEFNMDTVEYLGYILSPDGLTMSKEKVQTVLEWPVPRKVKDTPLRLPFQKLHAAELNYDTHDKELLAIFEAFKAWRHYLEGSGDPVDVVTDHKNLEYFSTTKVLHADRSDGRIFTSI